MKTFIYVTGSSGSGSNILARILGRLDCVLGAGETHTNMDHVFLSKLHEANRLCWNRQADFGEHNRHLERFNNLFEQIALDERLSDITHIVFKRSMISADNYRPDLCDIMECYPEAKILIIVRRPEAATYSSFRRKLGSNLRHCSVIQDEHLCLLSQDTKWLKDKCRVYSYEDFCKSPDKYARPLAEFCNLDRGQLEAAIRQESIDVSKIDRWSESLGEDVVASLRDFFSKRKRHWLELSTRIQEDRP